MSHHAPAPLLTSDARPEEVVEPVVDSAQPPEEACSGEIRFSDLSLSEPVQMAVRQAGYEQPTEIQAKIIPHMLAGRDVLAQSQTGSGKTAAFALPILSRIDPGQRKPQILVLAPTRELAIQVANSFASYGAGLPRLAVATIYGGQSYEPQLRQLRRGAQVVVGTPGRVIDHVQRGSLDLSGLNCLVLDEADEMLNMGFLEDVQFVLQHAPDDRQVALFSATLPAPIQAISQQYLRDPARISIATKTMTADSIRQRAVFVSPRDKLPALIRILEAEPTDGVIVFTKTKAATVTVAEALCREGIAAIALNGDMPQNARERTVARFKAGHVNVLVATDVAARGLDVSRVSHVFNFDLAHDTESYIHRIGRTGRAGRSGEAIIFLTHSQRRKLQAIERVTKQPIEVAPLPNADAINAMRIRRFKQQLADVAANEDLTLFRDLIAGYAAESGQPLEVIAAALAHIGQQGRPFLAVDRPQRTPEREDGRSGRSNQGPSGRGSRDERRGGPAGGRRLGPPRPGMERYRIQIGRRDGLKPGNIVGAVANEAGIDGELIGPIQIHDSYSTVDLPEGMPHDVFQSLRRAWVVGKQMRLARETPTELPARGAAPRTRPEKARKEGGADRRAGTPAPGQRKNKQAGKRKNRKSPS